jgi:hypothetical protein
VEPEAPGQDRARRWATLALRGAILAAGLFATTIVALVIIGLFYDSGDEGASSNDSDVLQGINVGAADEYALADVNHFDQDHVFFVRFPDGSFRAFYDKSARQQELDGSCRILYDETATTGTLPQVEGMRGAFVEDCDDKRSVWLVDGTFSFGAGYGDLDEFETGVDANGDVIIDTNERTCTRSKGVPGIPPFEVTTCQGAR